MRSMATGPLITTGNLSNVQNQDAGGINAFFQGSSILDPRGVGYIGAAPGQPGYSINAFMQSNEILALDVALAALSTTKIVAAAATTAATAMTLASTHAAGLAANLPLIPAGSAYATANKVTPGICLDAGFTTGDTTAASTSITIPAGAYRYFYKGQRIFVTAGATTTTPQFVTVAATPAIGATTLVVETAIVRTVTAAQIGATDPWSINVAWPYQIAGEIALADPSQLGARCVSVTGGASAIANNITIVGYDVWGNPQSELIAFAGTGAATVAGVKAFKWITSVTPSATDSGGGHTIAVGTLDVIGIPLRVDYEAQARIYVDKVGITADNVVPAVVTSPATTTTGDTRGTYALQTASDGSKRTVIYVSETIYNLCRATNLDRVPLLGVTPV